VTKAGVRQRGLERCIVFDQGAGDAVAHRTGLAGLAAALDIHQDVEGVGVLGQFQRLAHDHAAGFAGEELVDRLVIDDELAAAAAQEYTGNGRLAATGSVILGDCHQKTPWISSALGCWAVCGWAPPA
jgi:hypothetical protein